MPHNSMPVFAPSPSYCAAWNIPLYKVQFDILICSNAWKTGNRQDMTCQLACFWMLVKSDYGTTQGT